MSIPRVESGRSGNRPLVRIGSGTSIALYCIPRVGKFLAKFQVIDLVGKIVVIVVLGHAESKSGLHFVLQAIIQR